MTRQDLSDYNDGYLAFVMGENPDDNASQFWLLGFSDAQDEEERRYL